MRRTYYGLVRARGNTTPEATPRPRRRYAQGSEQGRIRWRIGNRHAALFTTESMIETRRRR